MTDNTNNEKNMELWNSWCDTKALGIDTKEVSYGKREFTAVDAQQQIKLATQKWGPYGTKWGLRSITWGEIGKVKTKTAIVPAEISIDALFWYPDGAFEISSEIKYRVGGDSRKKLLTDVTTKAFSKLGMCSDIFEGKFDGNKYTDQPQAQPAPAPQYQQPAQTAPQPVQQQQAPPAVQSPQPAAPVAQAPQSDEMHPLFIDKAEAKTSKSGNPMVKVNLIVTDGPYNGKKIYHYMTFGSEFPLNSANRMLMCATGAGLVHPPEPFGIAQVIQGKSLMAKLTTETYEGKEKLKIDGMEMAPGPTGPPAGTAPPATTNSELYKDSSNQPATTGVPQDGNDNDISLDEDIEMDEGDDFL